MLRWGRTRVHNKFFEWKKREMKSEYKMQNCGAQTNKEWEHLLVVCEQKKKNLAQIFIYTAVLFTTGGNCSTIANSGF